MKSKPFQFMPGSKAQFSARVGSSLTGSQFLIDDALVVVACYPVRGSENRYYVQSARGAQGYFYESDLVRVEA